MEVLFAQLLVGRFQPLFRLFTLGDVLEVTDEAVDLTLGIAPGHVGPVEELRFALGSSDRQFHMDRLTSLQHPPLDGGQFVGILARQEILIGLADHVLLGESHLWIDDQPIAQVAVLDENVVRRVVGDGLKALLARPQRLFGPHTFADVNRRPENRRLTPERDGANRRQEPEGRSVGPLGFQLIVADQALLPDGVDHLRAVSRVVVHLRPFATNDFLLAKSEGFVVGGVGKHNGGVFCAAERDQDGKSLCYGSKSLLAFL